jgi:hypothetical protein
LISAHSLSGHIRSAGLYLDIGKEERIAAGKPMAYIFYGSLIT